MTKTEVNELSMGHVQKLVIASDSYFKLAEGKRCDFFLVYLYFWIFLVCLEGASFFLDTEHGEGQLQLLCVDALYLNMIKPESPK